MYTLFTMINNKHNFTSVYSFIPQKRCSQVKFNKYNQNKYYTVSSPQTYLKTKFTKYLSVL